MDKRYEQTVEGAELRRPNLNDIARAAAQSEDWVLGELLRPWAAGGALPSGSVDKIILPAGFNRLTGGSFGTNEFAVVAPSGSTNGSLLIAPFRAIIGTRSAAAGEGWMNREVISGLFAPTVDGTWTNRVFITAVTSNRRWDLIYARVDIAGAESAEVRYFKGDDDNVAPTTVSVKRTVNVTVGVVQGTEAASPTVPALPADTATVFYIPLATVIVDAFFTVPGNILISKRAIREIAPIGNVAPVVGGCDARPAVTWSQNQGLSSWLGQASRPDLYLPADMTGRVERFFTMDFRGTPPFALGTSVIIDETIDWRRRVFEGLCQATDGSETAAWASAVLPIPGSLGPQPFPFMGQSFGNDYSSSVPDHFGRAAHFGSGNVPAMVSGAALEIYVTTAGRLCARTNATFNPAHIFFISLRASGQFTNA